MFRSDPKVWLLAGALLLRSLVPEGFMPAQGELVELCSMHGPRMVVADPNTGEILAEVDEESGGAPPCPFSLILGALAGPSLPVAASEPPLAPPPLPRSLIPNDDRPSLTLPGARGPPRPLLG